jgi:carboxyl-terminal processing protease
LRYFTLEGRPVYGGGGIIPDIFVPLDTTNSGVYYSSILWGGAVNQYAYDYVKSNGLFSNHKWASLNEFKSDFIVGADMINAFVNYTATELGILPYSMNEVNRSSQKIKVQIKSEIARQIWQENGFYSVYNSFDNEFKAAFDALK